MLDPGRQNHLSRAWGKRRRSERAGWSGRRPERNDRDISNR